ncbi:MAG: AlwI family type II restriction endonuclease [Ignavibacteria bacterium]|nr:AlwI family type II restriction endonuclease [Ignavibacteria bacterium]
MARIWLIEVAVRNPYRIRDFLKTLNEIEGEDWNDETQAKLQILLLKNKYYGYGITQFYNNLSTEQIDLINSNIDLSYEQAKDIMLSKNYVGGLAMRGRLSFNPLEKMGLAYIDNAGKIRVTQTGNNFLQENFDISKIFFKSFLKWQLPNPDMRDFSEEDGYSIKPFVGTLHLIHKVNSICRERGLATKGISRLEFKLFALTLINYNDIQEHAENLVSFREIYEALNTPTEKADYVERYISDNLTEYTNLRNAEDYMDNAIRFFRLTSYFYIRGNGWYIDIEPRRLIEITRLLESDNAAALNFESKEDYIEYIGNFDLPILPWERIEDLKNIIEGLFAEIKNYRGRLSATGITLPNFVEFEYENFTTGEYLEAIETLRNFRRTLNELEIKFNAKEVENIREYIRKLNGIRDLPNRTVMLEKYVTMALNSLNDAIKIKPNYPVGDDNEPTFTAPGNKPDIECFYNSFNTICEVTLLTNRAQWINEGQPVMRHLRNFEDDNIDKQAYCLFVAPSLHRDTINTFWISIKYEYEGRKQKIVPLRINDLILLLEYLIKMKEARISFYHSDLSGLFDNILSKVDVTGDSETWVREIPNYIVNWAENKLKRQNAN